MTIPGGTTMQTSLQPAAQFHEPVQPRSALRRAHDAAVGYHLLVAVLFTACLPVSLARGLGGRTQVGPFAGALDTARDAAAQAFSLPG
jgi:hypothetical protein